MKYILFSLPNDMGTPTVRIFDDITGHNEVKSEVQLSKPGLEVVSAGKIWINDEDGKKVFCIHQSVSLGLAFNKETGDKAAVTIKGLLNLDR